MRTIKKHWEPLIFRPILPTNWFCLEQRGITRCGETSFCRLGRDHHNATEDRRFFVVFHEFDKEHHLNEGLTYQYTVRGGNDIKPNNQLRYFTNLKDVENYMIYLMESTDRWIEEIHSEKHIDAYNKRIEDLQKANDFSRTSDYAV